MNVASTVFRNIAANWSGIVLNLAITFFLSPFVVNSLGKVYFGIWALTMQFTGYMYILDFGVRDSIIRYTARYRGLRQTDKLNRLLTMSFVIYAPIAVAAVAVTAIGVAGFPRWFGIEEAYVRESRIALGLVGLTIAQGFLFNGFTGILQGLQRFDIANVVGLVGNVVRAVLVVAAILAGWGIVGLAAIQFGLQLAGSLVTTYFALKLLRAEGMPFVPIWVGGRRGLALVRRIVGYSAFVFINNIAQKVILASDAVVVGLFLPVASVTYLAIAGNLIGLTKAIVSASVWVLMPLASHYASRRMSDDIRVLLVRASKGALLLVLPISTGFLLIGDQFIALWMGKEFAASAGELLFIFALGQIFSAPHYAMNAILMGINSHRTMALLRVAEAAANLGLSIWLVKRIGLLGVAWGTTIPHLAVTILVLPALTCRAVGLSLREYAAAVYVRPFLAVLPFAAGVFAVRAWYPPSSLIAFFAEIGLLLLPYLGTAYLVALTREERSLLLSRIVSRSTGRRLDHAALPASATVIPQRFEVQSAQEVSASPAPGRPIAQSSQSL